MSANRIQIGAIRAVYIGDYSDTVVLTRLTDFRTNGNQIIDVMPSDSLPALNYSGIQSGLHRAETTLTFLSYNEIVIRLTKGLTLSSSINDPSAQNEYVLVLIAGDTTKKESFYFPRVLTNRQRNTPLSKKDPSTTQVNFYIENRSPIVKLMDQETPAAIKISLGARSPF